MNTKNKNEKGFSLIELILYVTLVSLFLSAAVLFSWDIIYGREKAIRQHIVQESARIAMAKIGYEIKRAVAVNSISATQIVLENGANDTTINLNAGRIRITTGGVGPTNITSNQVTVTALTFTNLQSTDLNSRGIGVTMTMTQSNPPSKGQLTATTTLDGSYELKDQFNLGRRMLTNVLPATLNAAGTSLTGMTVQNVETGSAVINRMIVAWSGGGLPATRRITSINIGGGGAEFTGSVASGTNIDITNFTAASGTVNALTFVFNASMNGAVFDFTFIMSDGSYARARGLMYSTYTSCSQICAINGYNGFICRGSGSLCTSNGETTVAAGSTYCTGGTAVDTCCCKP